MGCPTSDSAKARLALPTPCHPQIAAVLLVHECSTSLHSTHLLLSEQVMAATIGIGVNIIVMIVIVMLIMTITTIMMMITSYHVDDM